MGADDTGIYTLTGHLNDGAVIPAFIETGEMQFAVNPRTQQVENYLTQLIDSYIAQDGGPLLMTLTTETGVVKYKIRSTSELKTVQNDLALGSKGRYWKVRIENVLGSQATLDSVQFNVLQLPRKR